MLERQFTEASSKTNKKCLKNVPFKGNSVKQPNDIANHSQMTQYLNRNRAIKKIEYQKPYLIQFMQPIVHCGAQNISSSTMLQQQRSHSTADRGSGEAMPSVGIGIWQSEHRTALQIAAPVDQISSVLVTRLLSVKFLLKVSKTRNCCGNFF